MTNITEWFETAAGEETIVSAVVGKHYKNTFSGEEPSEFNCPVNRVLPWTEAREYLSVEFNSGYGGADCYPVFAWTATKILTVLEYDGATFPAVYPRNPTDCVPGFTGEGCS